MPLLDPDPLERARVAGAAAPSHYEGAVARAVERIAAGELSKLVLAREVRVHGTADHEPGAILDALRVAFPACYCWCVGTPELAFVGASPELLVRRDGARAQTVALAGTARRSADPSVDDHLGEQLLQSAKDREEQAIVARRIERTLAPVSLWVAAADEPALAKVQNVQHLATPIRAQLARPVHALELAGLLHPTPAVGGEPREVAEPLIPELEGLDRGWYAGGVGWTDLAEDGEFCVALRCALLRGPMAHLYAGCGIVRDSVPGRGARRDRGQAPGAAPASDLRAAASAATASRWSSTFFRRSVRTSIRPGADSASSSSPTATTRCSRPPSAASADMSRPCEVAMWRSYASALGVLGHGQEVEDPAAVVVQAHDGELHARPARGEQAAGVVEQRHVADHARTRGGRWPARRRRPRTPRPSMPFAPRPARKRTGRSPAGKNASTSRTGIE